MIDNIEYYSENENRQKNRTLIPNVTRLKNEDYALLRAIEVAKSIDKEELIKRGKIKLHTNISNRIGDEHRMISVRIVIDNYERFFEDKKNNLEKFLD